MVDDEAPGSSPVATSTPPKRAVPSMLACLSTSPIRSSPGFLPYHNANTPWQRGLPKASICWVPHTAVAASSSFRPGSKRIAAAASSRLARHIARSTPLSGDPR